jgi:hypothetical protein
MTKVLTKEGRAYYTAPQTEPIPIDRTSIVISAGDSFPHITGESRVILLDQGAFQKYMMKFPEESRLYACSFDLRYDQRRKAAVLKVFELNTGATVVLWKERNRWLSCATEHIICD